MEIENKVICEICKRTFKSTVSLSHHIKKSHKDITHQEYYDKFLLKDSSNKYCNICNKETHYQGWKRGYTSTCGNENCRSNQIKKSHINNVNKGIANEKRKATNLNRYGVEHCSNSNELLDKAKQTYLKKYGVDNPMKSYKIKNKSLETKLNRYGDKLYNNREKAKSTMIVKYGVDNVSKTDEWKYKVKETCLGKYGAEHVMYLQETLDKIKETNLEKYGVEHSSQQQGWKEKLNKTWEGISEEKKNCIREKTYNTKKKNNTFNTSESEVSFEKILNENNISYHTQYNDSRYPFSCDFYIPDIDLFIELDLHWSHGFEPFNEDNANHIEKVNTWKKKSKDINFKGNYKIYYNNAINTWTVLDVKKIKAQKDNNLNFIRCYNKKDFNNIISRIKEEIKCLN